MPESPLMRLEDAAEALGVSTAVLYADLCDRWGLPTTVPWVLVRLSTARNAVAVCSAARERVAAFHIERARKLLEDAKG